MNSILRPSIPPTDERWEAQLRKGCLELAVLGSLRGGRRYGLEILRSLEAHVTLGLVEGTLYLILNRLKREGIVDAEWVDAGTGHPRKYYWLTDAGSDRLQDMSMFWRQLSADLETVLKPVGMRKEAGRAAR